MAHGKFEFRGTGLGFIWLFIWTMGLIIFTVGIFAPWAVAAQMRWLTAHTSIDGKQLCFKGSGAGFFANWLLIFFLSIITLFIYLPWGIIRYIRWIVNNTYFADPGDVEYLVDVKKDIRKTGKELFCPNCGSKLPPDALFCEQCGGRVER
ncbi:MAG: DUF898 family protein [Thermodesulfovibrionales bacterium]|nr:DUF898 family protein [Thermodesulfovibrionales bacterium]